MNIKSSHLFIYFRNKKFIIFFFFSGKSLLVRNLPREDGDDGDDEDRGDVYGRVGRRSSSTAAAEAAAADFDEDGEDGGVYLDEDPSLTFAEFSFGRISRENRVRQICIRIVLNP